MRDLEPNRHNSDAKDGPELLGPIRRVLGPESPKDPNHTQGPLGSRKCGLRSGPQGHWVVDGAS